ncbi:DUF2607 family protein [Vibrio sp. dsl-7]|uniref:DUF2607 family protein n=2 Tax=Vibrio chanodichtyis TaxID=3027932 RepID=A0ABT5V080_9VIBR|nr:DUF2607 family protein [Vibrio chanodichtyis]MDE1515061.1 DUF2607 family protein [Vibrio chanodichtyis]
MPKPMLHRSRLSIVALLTMALVLWFNVAVIDHQLDAHPEHHWQHDCQLFAGVNHGLPSTQWRLPQWPQTPPQSQVAQPIQRTLLLHSYFARSPPAA